MGEVTKKVIVGVIMETNFLTPEMTVEAKTTEAVDNQKKIIVEEAEVALTIISRMTDDFTALRIATIVQVLKMKEDMKTNLKISAEEIEVVEEDLKTIKIVMI